MAFKGRMAQPPETEVELLGVDTPSGPQDVTLTVKPPVYSTVRALEEAFGKGDHEGMKQIVSSEEAARRVTAWSGEGFTDETGAPVPCDVENVTAAIADVPGLYYLIILALVQGYQKALLKNFPTSPATTLEASAGSTASLAKPIKG